MITTTLTDFRKEMKQYLDRITNEMETLIINRGKDKGVVMLSMQQYSELCKEKELNSVPTDTPISKEALASIDKGLSDLESRKTIPHNEVMEIFKKYVQDRMDRTGSK